MRILTVVYYQLHAVQEDDGEENVPVVSRIVEKCIPRIISWVDAFDPFSEIQTDLAVHLLGTVLTYVDRKSDAFQKLIGAIKSRISYFVDEMTAKLNAKARQVETNEELKDLYVRNILKVWA